MGISEFIKVFKKEGKNMRGGLWSVMGKKSGSRHRASQMKYYSGGKFNKK